MHVEASSRSQVFKCGRACDFTMGFLCEPNVIWQMRCRVRARKSVPGDSVSIFSHRADRTGQGGACHPEKEQEAIQLKGTWGCLPNDPAGFARSSVTLGEGGGPLSAALCLLPTARRSLSPQPCDPKARIYTVAEAHRDDCGHSGHQWWRSGESPRRGEG